ncbi:unnamed protein product [Mytilus coruscus]|uniref:Uncharacterized protein n=1 Tax=Mytilus coruscus TaxID=42192 RepID=A0A6J8E178_MYTCO|nr:unnamed protein product [Mytilus coruscus]
MSLSTLRKNFYRIATLIIDHGADSMRSLLDHLIQKNYKVSFKDFVSAHQHEIYHQFNNAKCCQCSRNYHPSYKTTLGAWQMERLFDKNEPKPQNHKSTSKCEYCCSTVNSTLQIEHIDITLLRLFLVTFFEEDFWKSCFTSGMLFHDFLNTHKHDIFHLLQLNTPCCLCQVHPGYMVMVATEKDRLNKTQWETMFQVPEPPCTQHRSYFPNGYMLNPYSVSATIGIRHSDLDGRARMIILSKFCNMMTHIDQLLNARNTIFTHALKGELSNEDFTLLWNEIENSIIYVSNITCTVDSQKQGILELREKSPEESLCLELQCLILKLMQGNEHVLEQVELKITALTSNISDAVRNEVSIQLNNYSDIRRCGKICAHANDKFLIHRLVNELEIRALHVYQYIEKYCCDKFVTYFNEKLTDRFQSAEDVVNCSWKVIHYFIRTTTFKIGVGQIGTIAVNDWLTLALVNRLLEDEQFDQTDDRILEIHDFIEKYGCQNFVIDFNRKLAERFQSKENVVNCKWKVIHYFIRPSIFKVEIGQIGAVIEDDWLIQRLIKRFIKSGSYRHISNRLLEVTGYIEKYGCGQFVKDFNKTLFELFQSETNVEICELEVIYHCIRPTTFKVEIGQEGTFIKDSWLIQRLIKRLAESGSFKHKCNRLWKVKDYIEKYGCVQFVKDFNKTLFEWFQSENNVVNCELDVIYHFIRPTTFKVEIGQVGTFIKESWLIQRLMKRLTEPGSFEHSNDSLLEIKRYIEKYGCEQFIIYFNKQLMEWFQYEEIVKNCEWEVIHQFIRPSTFKIEIGQIGTVVEDDWLIQRLIKRLAEHGSFRLRIDSTCGVKGYIEKYGCEQFILYFNEQLRECFQYEDNVINCEWEVIHKFIRPATFNIEIGQIGTVINDGWLIQRLIQRLSEFGSFKPRVNSTWRVKGYIEKYGCEQKKL